MSLSQELRGTDSFIWCTKHAIGVGATSTVFIGRFKKTGEQVAIKAFNSASYARPREVQIRELEVVRKLKHRNIVEVLAIEDDHVSKQPVIIMELCSGGSLFQYLEEPENIFGLSEKEFLTALKHILDGMKYLRRSGIVHRDIKPGNIMRVKGEDGGYTYKLADFGAARQVDDEEEPLQSLCGTEEYLRADLYGHAVLRIGVGANYTTTVDLWSLGVTFYQLATGQLPFRPYGGRRNRETMHYLITRKESGIISGVQHDSPTGRIEWSNKLPTNCHLSRGLKPLITYMLAHLLESSPGKIWSFDELFEYTDNLGTMKRLDIFNTQTTEMHSVYVTPTASSVELSAKIEEQSDIEPKNQVLCWRNAVFNVDENDKLPRTQTETPLYLYSTEHNSGCFQLVNRQTPAGPKITSAYNLDNDVLIAKMGKACLFFFLILVMQVIEAQQHISSAADTLRNVYRDCVRSIQFRSSRVQQLQTEVEIKLDMLSHRTRFCLQTIANIPDDIDPTINDTKNKLADIIENLDILNNQYKQNLQPDITSMYNRLESLATLSFPHNFDELRCNEDDKCVERLEVLVESVGEIYDQFKRDKREKRLKYNEEQIHKMDKQKLRCKCVQAGSLLPDHCEPKLKILHSNFESWYRNINNNMRSLRCLEADLGKSSIKFNDFIKSLTQVEEKLQSVLVPVGQIFKTMAADLKISRDEIQTLKKNLTDAHNIPLIFKTMAADLKISRDEIQTLKKNLTDAQLENETRRAEVKLTQVPESISPRRIRVPKHIKEQFLSMGNDLEKTKHDISESARILEEMRVQDELLIEN